MTSASTMGHEYHRSPESYAMEASHGVSAFMARVRELSMYRDTSESLIADLMRYCENVETTLLKQNQQLSDELRDCKLDLADAVKTRRELQQDVQRYELDLGFERRENDSLKNRNPYICLLIDGDGLIFREEWVRQGIEGGKRAAYALRSAVASHCVDRGQDVEIVAKIVANLGGLGKAMVRDGSLDNTSDLKDFTLGFTQAKASFDFIDVGYGKERADSKIKELTRWNLQNHNCKHLLLGISHDSGYAPFLDEVLQDEKTRKRISLLEGVPTVHELIATNVNVLSLSEDLFRKEKLIERVLQRVTSAPSPAVAIAPILSPMTQQSKTTTSPKAVSPVAQAVKPLPPPQPPKPTPTPSSYALATTSKPASPPPQLSMPLAPKSNNATQRAKQQQQPSWNPGPRGLDDPIEVDPQVIESIKRRKDSEKFCNNHYLRGPCLKENCPFLHNSKPNKEEKKAIAKLARLNPCAAGQDCQIVDCIYGHHCPTLKDGWCLHPYCKFEEDAHPPGTKYRTPTSRNTY